MSLFGIPKCHQSSQSNESAVKYKINIVTFYLNGLKDKKKCHKRKKIENSSLGFLKIGHAGKV
jgi:hypothetical protein